MGNSDDYYLRKIIFYLLTLNKTERKETSIFKKLKHNDDLCPGLVERVEKILSYFQRYRKISYETQSPKDEGTDVFLRYYVEKKVRFICFQIKSYADLKGPDYLRKLKAQYVDSRGRFDFEDYYILLATDQKEDREKIRLINASLGSLEKITIVDPSQFLFFWGLKPTQVGAIIRSYIYGGDLLIQRALDRVKGLFKTQYSLIFFVLDKAIRRGFGSSVDMTDILYSKYLKEIYENFSMVEGEEEYMYPLNSSHYKSDDFEEMLESDLNFLSEKYFYINTENRTVTPDIDYLKPVVCLILDAQINYEFDSIETVEYLEQLIFGI